MNLLDENNDPNDDLPGTLRQGVDGTLYVKRDRSKSTGMLWLAIQRSEHVHSAVFFDSELHETRRVGVVPFTPAATAEYDVINFLGETLRYRLLGPMGHEVEVRYEPEGPWLSSGVPVDKLFDRNLVVPVPPVKVATDE